MKISGYIVDGVVFGVSWCGEFVYVLQCGSLEVSSSHLKNLQISKDSTALLFNPIRFKTSKT
jgi:hypothetical protein